MTLQELLHQIFGFPAFRANQEAVCRAATDGRDVLLVMPTGAGKSLCYQLPAIARGGTALVVSPLIALMDDQAAKLAALGLRVARIHSGLSKEDSRQACREYLDGTLQFLFIAPERMRVPGFPQMLARKKPALIAIDEAHCISAWGHDFRPDYRMLGEHLPALRPSPIIALTATATPAVQRDIVTQLQLSDPALFIHGFRRENLQIEVTEMSKPRRNEFVTKLLAKPENRPAIVYAPSKKATEELAAMLGGKAAAYHAGLQPSVRERVQRDFQTGKVEVVVATIAFGMGIDKADVRTVVHVALPASVEAYYQEIGRAGRDGLPSRTVLLHSFADRKMHEFFLERDYPAAAELARVAQVLTAEFQMPDLLRQRLKMDREMFDRAVEKLAAQGAAAIDMDGFVRGTGSTGWRTGYDAQLAFRRAQIDRMVTFAESQQCRMTALIRHFGDTADALRNCGHCDVCNPQGASGSTFRQPTTEDLRQLAAVLRGLDGSGRSVGKLHTELAAGALRGTAAAKDRGVFDALLDTLVRGGLVALAAEQFTNPEGNVIPFKKASLTHEGREAVKTGKLQGHELLVREAAGDVASAGRKQSSKRGSKAEREEVTAAYSPQQRMLEERLRAWRKAEAGKTGKPAFIVFADSVLRNVVNAEPQTMSELGRVSGIGPEKMERYGAEIVRICRGEDGGELSHSAGGSERPPGSSQGTKRFAVSLAAVDAKERDEGQSMKAAMPMKRESRISVPEIQPLDATQQAVDARLREWRKAEAERLGLPQFFVLSSSTLRSLVTVHPRTLPQLGSIAGIGTEKLARFGAGLLEVLNQA